MKILDNSPQSILGLLLFRIQSILILPHHAIIFLYLPLHRLLDVVIVRLRLGQLTPKKEVGDWVIIRK